MDKTKVKYELTIQPNLPPSHEHYQREITNRRLEKMQFPTRDEQFKRLIFWRLESIVHTSTVTIYVLDKS